MNDYEARHRHRAAWAKLIFTIAAVAFAGYLLVGLLSGSFDQVQVIP